MQAELDQLDGKPLSDSAKADIEWLKRSRRRDITDEILTEIPKTLYYKLAGSSSHMVQSHAQKYGLPLTDQSIDLYAAIKAFHGLLNKHSKVLDSDSHRVKIEQEKADLEIASVRHKAEILNLELLEKKRQLVPRDDVKSGLQWLSGKLRNLGRKLGTTYGKEAQTMFNELLDDLATEIERGRLRIE